MPIKSYVTIKLHYKQYFGHLNKAHMTILNASNYFHIIIKLSQYFD